MSASTKLVLAALGATLVATPILAQRDAGRGEARLSRECRQEIVALCGINRGELRSCLSEKKTQLSQPCADELRERIVARAQEGGGNGGFAGRAGRAAPAATLTYGTDQRQQIDIYRPADQTGLRPAVLFIHGGGWSFGNHKATVQSKPAHFTGNGYVFASTGYRLLPDAPVETQAEDVGAALRKLRAEAGALGIDPDRIVLMGHSAGAHLAALVATDPRYAGEAFEAIAGVVLLDGAGYDVAVNMAEGNPQTARIYTTAFGTDPARQAALSPVTHVGGPDARNWLALYVAQRDDSKAQSVGLVEALSASGAAARVVAISGTDHGGMNRDLGTPNGAAQTEAVDAFLARLFG
jgi:acetyl esterase/lipase